jgi:hypothetical protein
MLAQMHKLQVSCGVFLPYQLLFEKCYHQKYARRHEITVGPV